MESENQHDFATTLATFTRPRYELIATGAVHDGAEAVQQYFRDSRALFTDQRNELIALHHTDAGVFSEFWLLGTDSFGKAFRCQMIALFLFEGRDLVCERVYFDVGTILRQLAA